MSFLMPIQWYHYQADPIWPDGTFKFVFSGGARGAGRRGRSRVGGGGGRNGGGADGLISITIHGNHNNIHIQVHLVRCFTIRIWPK